MLQGLRPSWPGHEHNPDRNPIAGADANRSRRCRARRAFPLELIDEYWLMVFPIVLGRGIRLIPENHAQKLALVENEQFGDGIRLFRYVNT